MKLPCHDPSLDPDLRVRDLLQRLTLEEKAGFMASHQPAIARLDLPEFLVGAEAAHGVVSHEVATTVFPQPIGFASTWDPDLVKAMARVISTEARALQARRHGLGNLCLWAPTIDMERDPRWGRTEEGYGEDPLLTATLAQAFVEGIQGDDPWYLRAVATPKHFYANNHEEGRLNTSSGVDLRSLHEYYLKPFQQAVTQGHAASLMTAYNAINGVPAMIHPHILELVKGAWNLDGFVVCDGGALSLLVKEHKSFDSIEEALAASIRAGIDNISEDRNLVRLATLKALELQFLTEEDLNCALARVFKVRLRLGLWADPASDPYRGIPASALRSPGHKALAREVAEASVVLLANPSGPRGPLLPLEPDQKPVFLGPLADTMFTGWYGARPDRSQCLVEAWNARTPGITALHHNAKHLVRLSSTQGGPWQTRSWYDGRIWTGGHGDGDLMEVEDWGEGHLSFKVVHSGKWLQSDGHVKASSTTVGGWFPTESFSLVPETPTDPASDLPQGPCHLYDWQARPVLVDPEGFLSCETPDATLASPLQVELARNGIAEALALADEADVLVLCLGTHPLVPAKEERDRKVLDLPSHQVALLDRAAALGKPLVLVLVSGYPVVLPDLPVPVAVLWATHGGPAIAEALVDVLQGIKNPGGHLTMTWPSRGDDVGDIKEYDLHRGKKTYWYRDGPGAYPFGHGLSFTHFSVRSLDLSCQRINSRQERFQASIQVSNQGAREGSTVLQLYGRCTASSVPRPRRQLLAFRRIFLRAGESTTVSFVVETRQLAWWQEEKNQWSLEPGPWILEAGFSSGDLPVLVELLVTGHE